MKWTEESGQRVKTMRINNATVIVRRPAVSEQQQEAVAKSALESYARALSKMHKNDSGIL